MLTLQRYTTGEPAIMAAKQSLRYYKQTSLTAKTFSI